MQTLDLRAGRVVCQWRVPKGAAGHTLGVRSLVTHPESQSVAVGLSNGSMVVLDQRFGTVSRVRKVPVVHCARHAI